MSDINIQTFSGKVQVNNNLKVGSGHLFVDTLNNQVGLNTNTPLANLHVNGNTYVHSDLRVGSGIVMDQKVATFGATKTFVVEVVGGVFQIDGVSRPALTFHENQTYIFDQSHVSNSGHPIAFSEAVNGGTPYSTGVTSVGTPGQAGAKTTFKVSVGAPSNLFYYCVNHPSTMGSLAGTPSVVSTEAEIIVSGRLLATSIHGDGSALVNIPSSAINGTLSQWTDVNTNEIYYDLGNVGIGNQNPNSTLDVTGTGSFSGDLTVGTDKFFVDVSTGQVGVGTTTPAAGKALDVIGDLRATYLYGDGSNINNITSSQWVTTGNDIYYDTGSVRVGSTQPPVYTLDVLGDINFTGDIRKGGVVQTFGGGGSGSGGGVWTEISGTTQIHYSTGNVGIANTNPQHTLSVGSNLYVEDAGSNVLVVDGNVACNQVTLGQFEIVPSYGLDDVTAESNVTTDTVELNNVTTGLSTVSNVAVGGELAVTGNVVVSKDLTVTEELVASANVAVSGFVGTSGTGAIIVPVGTTEQRPTTGVLGMIRYNTTKSTLETYTTDWFPVVLVTPLYEFTSPHTFTRAAGDVRYGPTFNEMKTEYASEIWEQNPDWFNEVSGKQGFQLWTIPKTGTYRITAKGAQGGRTDGLGTYNNSPGNGAHIMADIAFTSGTKIVIIVGQAGEYPTGAQKSITSAGGGGATWILKENFTTANDQVYMVAGGGAGAERSNTNHTVGSADGSSQGTLGGGGAGNGWNYGDGGGAGWTGNGTGTNNSEGLSPTNGAAGGNYGYTSGYASVGGFGGGGGGGLHVPGGGGGASGGRTAIGATPYDSTGSDNSQGGTSYIMPSGTGGITVTNPTFSGNHTDADGSVHIELLT